MSERIQSAIDIGALTVLGGVLLGILQGATIVLTFVWAVFRLYESKTTRKICAATKTKYRKWRNG